MSAHPLFVMLGTSAAVTVAWLWFTALERFAPRDEHPLVPFDDWLDEEAVADARDERQARRRQHDRDQRSGCC